MTEPRPLARRSLPDGPLEVLSQQECLALLAKHRFGRLAFVGEGGWLLILPVNYVFSEPNVVIRTGPGAKLRDAPLSTVAFEIDDADALGDWGWSVVAQGPAFDITDADDAYSQALRELDPRPFAPGPKAHWIKVSATRVSGRRFGAVPAAELAVEL